MSDKPEKITPPKDIPSEKPQDQKISNIPAVQGYDDMQLYMERKRAEQQKELADDLKKIEDRPIPAYFEILADKSPVYKKNLESMQNYKEEVAEGRKKALSVADSHAEKTLNRLEQVEPKWKPFLDKLKEHDKSGKSGHIYNQLSAVESTSDIPKIGVLPPDTTLDHYQKWKDANEMKKEPSHYYSKDSNLSPKDAKSIYALPNDNPATIKTQWKTTKNTEVATGTVARTDSEEGGGEQFFVFDPTTLEYIEDEKN